MSETTLQADTMAASEGLDLFRAHDLIAALRAARGETLDAFGKLVGVSSKGRMSEIERGQVTATPEQALAIEGLSAGTINASALNPIIAKARGEEGLFDHGTPDSAKMEAVSPGKSADDFPVIEMPGRALSPTDPCSGDGLAPAGTSGGPAGLGLQDSANASQGVDASAAAGFDPGGSGASFAAEAAE